jgi:glycosyltransferase 2 family protein
MISCVFLNGCDLPIWSNGCNVWPRSRTIWGDRFWPSGRLSTGAWPLRALLVGYAVNSILPARLGEVYRAHYLARFAGLSSSSVLATIVIERLLDLVAVISALAFGLTLAGGGDRASHHVLAGGATIAVAAVSGLSLIVWLLSRHSVEDLLLLVVARIPGGAIARRAGGMVANFTQALQCVRTRHFFFEALLTAPIWMSEAAAIWSVCRAVGMDLDLTGVLSLRRPLRPGVSPMS